MAFQRGDVLVNVIVAEDDRELSDLAAEGGYRGPWTCSPGQKHSTLAYPRPADYAVNREYAMSSGDAKYSHGYISMACALSKGTRAHVDNFTMTFNQVGESPQNWPGQNVFHRSLHHRALKEQVPDHRTTSKSATEGLRPG